MKKINKNILAIETSSNYLGLGLFDNENKLSIINHYLPNSHDTLLAESIRYLLNLNNLKVNDLDFVTISSGPGSFTGLRIGCSLAKALCFEEDLELLEDLDELNSNQPKNPKLISVSSLELLLIDFLNKNLEQILSNHLGQNNQSNQSNHSNLSNFEFNVNIYLKSHKNIYYKQIVEFKINKEQVNSFEVTSSKDRSIKELSSQIITKFHNIELIEINEKFQTEVETDLSFNNFNITNSIELIDYLKNKSLYYFVELNVENLLYPTLKKIKNGEFEDPSTFVPLYAQEFKLNNNNNK